MATKGGERDGAPSAKVTRLKAVESHSSAGSSSFAQSCSEVAARLARENGSGGWSQALWEVLLDGRSVWLEAAEVRAMMETQLVVAASLLGLCGSEALGRWWEPIFGGQYLSRGWAWLLFGLVVPLWSLWCGEMWKGGAEGMARLRRLNLLAGLSLGLAGASALSGRQLLVRRGPLWLLPALRAAALATLPADLLGRRWGLLLGTVAAPVLASLAVGRLCGLGGAWELWALVQGCLVFASAQWEMQSLLEGGFKGWRHSLSLTTASAWADSLLSVALAIPIVIVTAPPPPPCPVLILDEDKLVRITKQIFAALTR